MILEIFKDNGLAHMSYILACENTKEAVLIDPMRNIEGYSDVIHENGLRLKYIINTHPHADFVSGHRQMADKFGALNIYHKDVPATFPFQSVKDQEILTVGDTLQVTILETPGHTPFCISCLVKEDGVDKLLFSGDFLFSGGVGRPDLLGDETKKELVHQAYHSCLKLGALSDDVMVCPSHSGGTMCGKDLKNSFLTTVGIEKRVNKAFSLALSDKDGFIGYMDQQDIDTPAHFRKMGAINLKGADRVLRTDEIPFISGKEAYRMDRKIIDMRDVYAFMGRHIKGSISIAHNANVALIAGSVLSQDQEYIVLIPSSENPKIMLQSIVRKLGSVGIDKIAGCVVDGIHRLKKGDLPLTSMWTVNEEEIRLDSSFKIIELGQERIIGVDSEKVELSAIQSYVFQPGTKYTFICSNSFKSMTAASLHQELDNIYFLLQ